MLTVKQEKYVQNLIKGMSQREAYRNAFPSSKKWKDNVVDSKASIMFNSGKIMERYNNLISKAQDKAIMTAKERMTWLTKVINGDVKDTVYYNVNGVNTPIEKIADINTKIKAIDTLNKMDNTYQQNINISGSLDNPYTKLSEEELRKLAGDL